MVGMAVGLFILAGLTALYMNAKSSYVHQGSLAALQGTRRAVIHSLGHGVRSAGYFVDPLRTTRAAVFLPAERFARGQFLTGEDGDATTSDSVSFRFETQSGDDLPDCLGSVNQGAQKIVVQNTLTVNSKGELTCAVEGGSPVALVGGIAHMALRYSVDTDGDGEPDAYLTAGSITAADLWSEVHAVRARLTFRQLATEGAGAASARDLPPLVHIFALMNRP